jgi:TetR/AcrR family transcriptional regulator
VIQTPRLPAIERRATVLEAACCIFSRGSYHGATTAEIAREAGITEPILYRHFESKRDLYFACLDHAWARLRGMWEEAVGEEADPALWLSAMGRAYLETEDRTALLADLWIQALSEAGQDPAIRKYLRRQMREVHRFVAGVMRRSQGVGGIVPTRDADAEAWVFVSLGVLGTMGRRLGGLLEDDLPQIMSARREWMTGKRLAEAPLGMRPQG